MGPVIDKANDYLAACKLTTTSQITKMKRDKRLVEIGYHCKMQFSVESTIGVGGDDCNFSENDSHIDLINILSKTM